MCIGELDACSGRELHGSGVRTSRQQYCAGLWSFGQPQWIIARLIAACREVVQCMLEFPELIGGSIGRLCTDIMRACDGAVIAKSGAEGYLAWNSSLFAISDGLGIAVKIEDGGERAIGPAAVAILDQLHQLDDGRADRLSKWCHKPIYNFRGEIVGELVPTFQLSRS